jgi:hypothetical protein
LIIALATYRTGDHAQAEDVRPMQQLFDPKRGTLSIASEEAKAEAAAAHRAQNELARQREAYFHPDSRVGRAEAKAEAAREQNRYAYERYINFHAGASDSEKLTPDEDAREFSDKYGHEIHWMPPDPNKRPVPPGENWPSDR